MTGLLLSSALIGNLAAGYVLGRVRPLHRVSDWAEWQKYGHPTGLRRAAVWTVLSASNLAWIATHPRKARHAWRHRNDPPPPRSPAVDIPRYDPHWAANRRAAADRLRPEWESEVEVRFAHGPTVWIARHSVMTNAPAGEVRIEGFIASSSGQPPSGDTVRLAYLGIPGRGALADITASVALYSRLDVPHIRIRTTIQPEDHPA